METDRIAQAMTDFIKGGDNSDVSLLRKVLHTDFRVASNNFMGVSGVTMIDREKYISNVEHGIFGGVPRTMAIESIEECGTIATVRISLKSVQNNFVSFNSFVLDTDDEWKLIFNLAIVEAVK